MLKIGIVGGGIRGQLFAKALATAPGVTVAGIADPSPAARQASERSIGVSAYASHRELLDRGVDAVVIATPDFAHVEAALDAAEAGAHLLIEKPLATTVTDAMAIRDTVTRAGTQAYVAFENRWATTFRQLHSLVRNGDLGQVVAQAARLSNTRYVPTKMIGWAARSSPAWFLMPHTVDMTLWLSGAHVQHVQARGVRGVLDAAGLDTWDGVFALLTLTDGTVVSLESMWSLPETSPSIVDYKLEVIGSAGVAHIDHHDQMLRVTGSTYHLPRTLSTHAAGEDHSPAAWMARSFARRLQGSDEPMPDIHHGFHVTEVIAAIHTSLDSGTTVDLPPTEADH